MKKIVVSTVLLTTFSLASLTALAQAQSREDILKQIEAKRAELDALETKLLAPAEEDRARYAEFLRSPDTGLIRLLPREKYDSATYTASKKSVVLRGGGAYYSFTRKTHEYGYGSDIELSRGQFLTGFAGANYGMMTNLGDIPLEMVSLDLPQVNALARYAPAKEEPQARVEIQRLMQGGEIDGVAANRALPVRLDSTYVLRSIDYERSDVLVAFRVVRMDSDGSATILWKLLKKYPAPRLARN